LSPTSEAPRAAAAQDDGKIVVVGVAFNVAAGELTMVRYLPNGSLDPGFGVDGRATNFNASRALLAKLGISADNTRRSYIKFDVSAGRVVDAPVARLSSQICAPSFGRWRSRIRSGARHGYTASF
jgi:hypothetical protein